MHYFLRQKYPITLIFIITFTGVVAYLVFKGEFNSPYEWVYDKDFRDKGLLFMLSTLVVIFGIEFLQQKQRNQIFVDSLKILGVGYNIHFIASNSYNLLIDLNVIEEEKIDIIFHPFFKSSKDFGDKKQTTQNFEINYKELINKLNKITLSLENINCKISANKFKEYRISFEKQNKEIQDKFSFVLKTESSDILYFYKLHEGLKKVIWDLDKIIKNEDTNLTRKKRLIVGLLILVGVSIEFYKNYQSLFFFTEYNYEETLLTKEMLIKLKKLENINL